MLGYDRRPRKPAQASEAEAEAQVSVYFAELESGPVRPLRETTDAGPGFHTGFRAGAGIGFRIPLVQAATRYGRMLPN